MLHFLNEKGIVPEIGMTYDFKNISDAVGAQDSGSVNGKIIVRVRYNP